MDGMHPLALARLALLSIAALGGLAGAWAQDATASLPLWAQEKLAESRRDPKSFDRYYSKGRKVADFCANCHGPNGHSVKPEVPNLAGQNLIYVLTQLGKFSEGKRKQFFMEGLMKALTPEEKVAVAIYFTSQEPKAVPVANPVLAARGKALYAKGCFKCHGDDAYGDENNARLAGQGPEYLTANMKRYKEGSATRLDEKMTKAVKALTDEDMKALVAYMGSLK